MLPYIKLKIRIEDVVILKKLYSTKGCIATTYDNMTEGSDQRMLTFFIRKSCIKDSDKDIFKNLKSSNYDIFSSSIIKEMLFENVKRKIYLSGKHKRWLFEKNYFFLPRVYQYPLNGSLKENAIKFYQEAIFRYLSDADFYKKSPLGYAFIRKNIFKGKNHFLVPELKPEDIELNNQGRLQLITTNRNAYYSRYKLLKRAQKSILVQYFSFTLDNYGKSLVELLLKKLEEGVKVYFMVDGRGARKHYHKDYIKLLVKHGAKVKVYNPIFKNLTIPLRFLKSGPVNGLIASNHDKFIIVDDKYMITGGRNIGRRYFILPKEMPKGNYSFKDMDIYVEFKKYPVSVLKAYFTEFYSIYARTIKNSPELTPEEAIKIRTEMQNCLSAIEERMTSKELSAETAENFPWLNREISIYGLDQFEINPSDWMPIQGFDNTTSMLGIHELSDKIFKLVDNAEDTIFIQNPYLILTDKMRKHLRKAALRGVKVVMLTCTYISTDSFMTINHFWLDWKNILKDIPNSEIYGYLGPHKMHSKVWVIDGEYSIVGSYNMDNLSEAHNSEFSVVVKSPDFAKTLVKTIERDIDNAIKFDRENNIGPASPEGAQAVHDKYSKYLIYAKLFKRWL